MSALRLGAHAGAPLQTVSYSYFYERNLVLGARPAEIARMEGVKNPSAVPGMIIRVSDQLRCGEISLFEVDQEEAEAVKARLEANRAKWRETCSIKISNKR